VQTRSTEPASLAALRRTFASIAPHAATLSRDERARLRDQVCTVVGDLKAAGELPERVVVIIRSVAREEGIGPSGDGLVSEAVAWCIADYFEDTAE